MCIEWTDAVKQVDTDTTAMWNSGSITDKAILDKHVKYSIRLTIGFWVLTVLTGNLMCINSLAQSFLTKPVLDTVVIFKFQYEFSL